ncbi:uncharacterized protein LOC100831744 [Brachypodium distachyon]|uniref:Knottin scorpion toxin-like domain-containing protein n=1 Tax=Brachypodium distachyon TaxID=15368 RepID=I1HW73_BRADI|nr:uncharacterized protein LOC100831744 [Brachypodium distachyon]KQJ92836.1 hypothetical protein BRADI_3g01010v3 [Brachypodium distachyon]|eukprot:XP_003571645.1 uncharacterized protein LOC100831744 [Brachypodium distachyon]
MTGKKKQPAPLLVLLAILLITTLEMVPEIAAAGNEKLCDVLSPRCGGMCYVSKCSSCCKNHGLSDGHCRLNHGIVCYCCRGPNSGEQQRMLKVIPASPPPPRRPLLHA